MGACCTKLENKNPSKLDTYCETLNNKNNNINFVPDTKGNPITLDQINKSINEWKKMVKIPKKNSQNGDDGDVLECDNANIIETNNQLNINKINKNIDEKHLRCSVISIDNSHLFEEFCDNKKLIKGFSDVSSTLHFTGLNSKDLVGSKLVPKNIATNPAFGGFGSQSLFNILEELDQKTFFPILNLHNDGDINPISEKNENKIFIQNRSIYKKKKANVKREHSISLTAKSKLTVKKKEYLENNIQSEETNNNNIHINSNAIINRSNDPRDDNNEESVSSKINNNNAAIYSGAIGSEAEDNFEFCQESIFYHVEKINLGLIDNCEKKQKRETILANCSIINGIALPVCEKNEKCKTMHRKQNVVHNISHESLSLDWKKMNQSLNMRSSAEINSDYLKSLQFFLSIKQDIYDDSALLSGILALLNFDKVFEKRLFHDIVQFQVGNFYEVRFYVNGCFRCMIIDDTMPVNKTDGKVVFSKCPSSPSLEQKLNLIEKGIFFLYKGASLYVSSNPALEIFHLTGWIPEICAFDEITNTADLWEKLHSNFSEGNILVCLGTGKVKDPYIFWKESSKIASKSTNLIQDYYYTVLEVVEEGDLKLMKCKNPYGLKPSISLNTKYVNELEMKKDEDSGCFWLDFEAVISVFSHIFVAWNSDVFPYKYHLISSWKNMGLSSKFYDEDYSLEYSPQFVITIPEHKEDFEMRILLEKHISQLDSKGNGETISYKLFWFEGFPIIYPVAHLRTIQKPSREINSDVFIFEASQEVEQYVLVILKNDYSSSKTGSCDTSFSLDVYSFVDISIKELPQRDILKSQKVYDTWSISRPGGNLLSPNFVFNPQYKFTLSSMQHIQIKLETAVLASVMVMLFEKGRNVCKLPYDCVLQNKSPRFFYNSFSHFECVLPSGDFAIMCVSEEEKTIERFCLEVNLLPMSTQVEDLKLEKISSCTNKFQYLELLMGDWTRSNNRGVKSDNFHLIMKNPGYTFHISTRTNIHFILRESKQITLEEIPHLALQLYRIEVNDTYSLIYDGTTEPCSFWGFYSDELELEPNIYGYLVLCINLQKFQTAKFELEIQSNQRLSNIKPNSLLNTKRKSFDILSKWDKSSAGGGPLEPSFLKNPQFEITPSKSTPAVIEVASRDNLFLGMILIELTPGSGLILDGSSLGQHTNLNSISGENNFRSMNVQYREEILVKKVNLEQGKKYLLIPFTKKSNQFGYFDIKIMTDEDITVKESSYIFSFNIIKGIL